MQDQYPTLFERAKVRPRIHRVFSTGGFVLALGLVLALVATGDGEIGQRFSRALGKGILLIGFAGAYFGWALTLRATKDPAWAALIQNKIRRVYPIEAPNEPSVGVETESGEKLFVSCQTREQQQAILAEFRAGGIAVEAG